LVFGAQGIFFTLAAASDRVFKTKLAVKNSDVLIRVKASSQPTAAASSKKWQVAGPQSVTQSVEERTPWTNSKSGGSKNSRSNKRSRVCTHFKSALINMYTRVCERK
jgi:hypothetical protein